ncbi:hypothetical protein E5226_17045 [Cellulomonas shaoxiangyii]|nr:hypothetical protein E5226_17045 [Cellulomonas shaoxiangyii]
MTRPPSVAPAWPGAGARPGEADTQPIRVDAGPGPAPAAAVDPGAGALPPTLAEASVSPLAVEAEAIAGEDALRRAEEDADDRSWDVSESTATFVPLPRPGGDAPPAPDRPTDGRPDGEDGRPT